MTTEQLPALNACLNTVSAVLLAGGYVSIRRGLKERHIKFMIAALVTSGLFLVSYVIYHALHGSTKYEVHDWTRPVYFAILLTHIVLAAVNVPMVLVTVVHAARGRFDKHRRIARWTLGVWFYVSVTGVVIYLMLYGI